MSLNNRDPIDGDDQSMKHLGIVSGDLIHVISRCRISDGTATERSVTDSWCKSASDSTLPDETANVATNAMETETVDDIDVKAATDYDENGEITIGYDKAASSETVSNMENMDHYASDVAELGTTGTSSDYFRVAITVTVTEFTPCC